MTIKNIDESNKLTKNEVNVGKNEVTVGKNEVTVGKNEVTVGKKRGRKPKNSLENQKSIEKEDNILVIIEDIIENGNDNNLDMIDCSTFFKCNSENDTNKDENEIKTNALLLNKGNDDSTNALKEPVLKKRGRKPKGGKIIHQFTPLNATKEIKPNVILHLKCSLNDLKSDLHLNSNIQSFNFLSNKNEEIYELLYQPKLNNNNNNNIDTEVCNKINNEIHYNEDEAQLKENGMKELWKKLKELEHNLHINNINGKKSACFWCTYEFDNPTIYIPKSYIKDTYHVYGCFCSPECATSYLMNENIDTSVKFERYHLLNHIYSKIYDYTKNIKPAPNPYYILDRYYGNLSIQEYRSLLKNERLFLVVDKPLTRILPELHEDNDDFIINNKIIPSNSYQMKKKLLKKQQAKSVTLNENFGLQ